MKAAGFPQAELCVPGHRRWSNSLKLLASIHAPRQYQRKECLNDVLIFLTAAKAGIPVLTANRDEFDLIQQVALAGRFVHY